MGKREREIDIADMQCWVFRMAQKRWNITSVQCAEIFHDNDVLNFIRENYDILHMSSYECALDDVEILLKNRGISV